MTMTINWYISYIRFSTPDQLNGHSLKRQVDLSKEYAKKRGLVLYDSLKMEDLGISAFKGEHRTKGSLGRFLTLVEAGSIPRGTTLIVESLDRLSREGVFEALTLFMNIIRAGIKVVTLADETEYTRESTDANLGMQLMLSMVSLGRGHEESLMKSMRLGAAWKTKRQNIGQKKLTGKCPAWLKLNEEKTAFSKIPDCCGTVDKIFKMSRSGIGAESIAKTLNKEGHSWMPQNGWRKSYIHKILHNRAVLGEFQPHTGRKSKRTPCGEPIKDYYPAIVTEELFYSVQHTGERVFGGRNGKISNLFSGLAKCGYCGGSMRFVDKGKPPKGGSYFVCDRSVRGLGCQRHSWKYPEIEEMVLRYCKGLTVGDLLREEKSKDSELAALNDELAVVNGKLDKLVDRIQNLTEQIADSSHKMVREELSKKLEKFLDDQKSLTEDKEKLELRISKMVTVKEDTKEQIANLKELMEFMQRERGDKLIDVRRRLRYRLRSLISDIKVYPMGNKLWFKGARNKDMRELTINFKSGSYRIFSPSTDTVLKQAYEHEEGRTYFPFINGHGKWDVDIEIDEKEEEQCEVPACSELIN